MLIKSKKDSLLRNAVFLGEGIFTMGLVKTIYNVLGGFYNWYNNTFVYESVHKLHKNMKIFLYLFNKKILGQKKNRIGNMPNCTMIYT